MIHVNAGSKYLIGSNKKSILKKTRVVGLISFTFNVEIVFGFFRPPESGCLSEVMISEILNQHL